MPSAPLLVTLVDPETNIEWTVYVLNKRRKTNAHQQQKVSGEGVTLKNEKTPFLRLLQGKESPENVQLRYKLYKEMVQRQHQRSFQILNDLNGEILQNINRLVATEPSDQTIDTAVIVPNSSISTGSKFIPLLETFLKTKNKKTKTVLLTAKECSTIRQTLKTIIDAVTETDDDGITDSEDDDLEFNKRLSFDLDIVEEWCNRQYESTGKDFETSDTRIVLIFEDIDSFNLSILNRLLRLLFSFIGRVPFKLIFNIDTNLQNFFIQKLSVDVLHFLHIQSFKAEQTDLVLNQLVNDIMIDEEYLIGSNITEFVMERFINKIKTTDEFLKILNLGKMCFFFNNPNSVVLHKLNNKEEIDLPVEHLKSLRMLPSFKRHVNSLVDSFDGKNDSRASIEGLLKDDTQLISFLKESYRAYKTYISNFKSVYKILTEVLFLVLKNEHKKNYLEVYSKLSSGDEFVRIQFINEIIALLKERVEIEEITLITGKVSELSDFDDLIQNLNAKLKFEIDMGKLGKYGLEDDASCLQYKIELRKIKDTFIKIFDDFFKKILKMDIFNKKISFLEIFQINDVEILQNTITPRYRSIIEDSLINHEVYLKSSEKTVPLLREIDEYLDPLITSIYQIYRETTLHLNIFDFYQAFKFSMDKDFIIDKFNEVLDHGDKIFENYLNDDLRFKFIYKLFNGQSKDEIWDKLSLVFFLQKCEELISFGFFKHGTKKRGDVLEKAIWKDL